MRIICSLFAVVLIACGGSLSDEQRKLIREESRQREIRRVTEVQLTEEAFKKGREIVTAIERFRSDSVQIDSMVAAQEGKIRFLVPGEGNTLAIEKQLIDAYLASDSGGMVDNVQILRDKAGKATDSLLYTQPVIVKQADGVDRLVGVWNIWLSRKQLILGMDDE